MAISTYNNEQVKERYDRLPDVLKHAMYSAAIAEKMFALGKRHGLTVEKIGLMSEETGYIVLGLKSPRTFTTALAERLQIPADAAEKMALEISHEVFFPLREALKQAHQVEIGEGAMTNKETGDKKQETRQGSPTQLIPQVNKVSVVPPVPASAPKSPTVAPSPQPKPVPTEKPIIPQAPIAAPKPTLPSPTILSTEVKSPPPAPVLSKPEMSKPPETPKAEPPKKTPATVRIITENLEKEIAPLINTIRNGDPAGFLSREETEKLIAEKQIENKSLGVRGEGLGTAEHSVPPMPPSSPIPPISEIKITPPPSPAPPAPQQKNSIDLRGSTHPPMSPPSPPPAISTNPKIPPIDLRPAPPKAPPPPQNTPEKTRPYQGYDPYREPIE